MRKSNPGKYTRESEDPWHGAAKLNRSATWVQPCASPFDSLSLSLSLSFPLFFSFLFFPFFFPCNSSATPAFSLSLFSNFLQPLFCSFPTPFSLLVRLACWIRSTDIYWLLNFCPAATIRTQYRAYLHRRIQRRGAGVSAQRKVPAMNHPKRPRRFLERHWRKSHASLIKFLRAYRWIYVFRIKCSHTCLRLPDQLY